MIPNLFQSDLTNPYIMIELIGIMFLSIIGRYFIVAGLFYLLFYWRKNSETLQCKINLRPYPSNQFRTEIKWSLITAFIFSIAGALTVLAWQKGYTAFYENTDKYGLIYLIISIPIYLLIHETYYYWTHRLMHQPCLFNIVHKIHHKSYIPSPWTAFSFHPVESIIESFILPLMIFIIPIHYIALLVYLAIMTISSVINHLDIEVFPKGTEKHWLGKWFIGATHHSLHHSQPRFNYGFYFTFWDKWQKTESPEFLPLFKSKSAKLKENLK